MAKSQSQSQKALLGGGHRSSIETTGIWKCTVSGVQGRSLQINSTSIQLATFFSTVFVWWRKMSKTSVGTSNSIYLKLSAKCVTAQMSQSYVVTEMKRDFSSWGISSMHQSDSKTKESVTSGLLWHTEWHLQITVLHKEYFPRNNLV